MARGKKKRPGVTLMKPNKERRTGWRARYVDPDSGRTKWETLPADLTKRDQREDWAVRLSQRNARRRRELEEGAIPASNVSIEDAERRFFDSLAKKRERTRQTYEEGTRHFLAWAKRHRLESCDDLTRGKLMEFRSALLAEASATATFNKWLRSNKRMWGFWIDSELCPKLTLGDLKRVKLERIEVERRDYLKPAKLRKLLEATERHDGEVFAMTREEKDLGIKGTTPKYPGIGPFVVFLLLSGMRRGEGLSLEWDQVDFEAPDDQERVIGKIHIPPGKSKTHKARDVRLNVSPILVKLLKAQHLKTGGKGSVWGLSVDEVVDALDRLRSDYGAPSEAHYQGLRVTCSTYLANASGVPNGGPYGAAEQLGHGLEVMRDHYAGRVSVSPSVKTLEKAMGIEKVARRIAGSAPKKRRLRSVSL